MEVCILTDSDSSSVDDNYKIEDGSVRSSSPKSDSSVSEISEASDASLSLEFSDVSDDLHHQDILIEDFDCLKMSEDEAEEMMRKGADMRHVLCTSWKLQPKFPIGKKMKSTGLLKSAPGQALRDMAEAQKLAIVEHERTARIKIKVPPGFERMFDSQNLDVSILNEPAPILVSYADGSNTLTLASEPLCLHNITVSCAVDSSHVFIQQMKNPTYEGLVPLEKAIFEAFEDEAPMPLLRPIATGSLLAVFSDDKWYRCQVVSFNENKDSCDVKFVDHGGYTTVQVSELRQLRSDFVRLPFQALEVYIAHISPANDEIIIDIASDILFRDDVSIQLLGFAEDGIPVIQAYFYQGDYINLFTQEILDDCYNVLLEAHPEYTPTPTSSSDMSDTTSTCSSEPISLEETNLDAGSTDEGVWSHQSGDESVSSPEPVLIGEETNMAAYCPEQAVYSPLQAVYSSETTVYSTEQAVYSPEDGLYPVDSQVAWVPVQQPMLAYYVPDPVTGELYYVTAPLVLLPQEVQFTDENQGEVPEEELESKPYEEWTQEDYEIYYSSM